jgi:prepilin-type N-terminal cleavage/methylation domain-containing protein
MSRRSPFTIIELLAVMVIISILAALILGVSKYATAKGHETRTHSQLEALADAIEHFKEDRGYYPIGEIQFSDQEVFTGYDKIDGTVFDVPPPTKTGKFYSSQTGAPYIPGYKGGLYLDAWKRPFLYRRKSDGSHINSNNFDLWSAGRNGKIGDEDDITNWKRNN